MPSARRDAAVFLRAAEGFLIPPPEAQAGAPPGRSRARHAAIRKHVPHAGSREVAPHALVIGFDWQMPIFRA